MGASEAELRTWCEGAAGGRVVRYERIGTGASRATIAVDVARNGANAPLEAVLRVDTGDGPMAGTELSLAREATIYQALAGTGVLVPAIIAVRPTGDAFLMERADGDSAGGDRPELIARYVDALAELHAVDPLTLGLPADELPGDGPEHALLGLRRWQRVADAKVRRPLPLARFTFGWLERHVPAAVERTVVCHGDVGPGNFLHRNGRVTALLDWEFWHVGDPMDDLGWLAFRGHHMTFGCGDLDASLARWSEQTGLPVDPWRVAYYRAFVMLQWLVSCAGALDGGVTKMDPSVYEALIPILAKVLPEALAELADPAGTDEPVAGGGGDLDDLDELDDAALDEVVRMAMPDDDRRLIAAFARRGAAQAAALPHLAIITDKPLAPIGAMA